MILRGKIVNDPIQLGGMGRIDSNYQTWLDSEFDLIKVVILNIKQNKSWSLILNLPYCLRTAYFRIYEFKNRKKTNFLFTVHSNIYYLFNFLLNIINKLYKNIYEKLN